VYARFSFELFVLFRSKRSVLSSLGDYLMENAWERRGEMSAPPVAGANETHQFPPYTIFYHLYLPSLRIFSHDLSLLKNFFWVGRKH
jgi:hypothetical protein